jgi:carboxypeptidase Q
MKKVFACLILITSFQVFGQTDSILVRKIFNEALSNGKSYENLEYLCKKIGGRLSGSPQSLAAVEYTKKLMESLKLDTVYLQPVMVPQWIRGKKEIARVLKSRKHGALNLRICALGNTIGTGEPGITAEVIEVKSIAELAQLGKEKINGKIVFFNRPLDPTKINTFQAYSGAVDQRSSGPSEAAKYGAIAVIVRSMTTRLDIYPHTGGARYLANVPKIPAVAVATIDAEMLSGLLKTEPDLKIFLKTSSEMLQDVLSYNVIGEIRGTEKPDEIIVVGGHLDSWDQGEGAHDDGAGCVQSIEVLRIIKSLGIKPKRTIRAVMFMNEENGLRGGTKYAEIAQNKKEVHIAGIESDAGGFSPRGFGIDGSDEKIAKITSWKSLLAPYGVYDIARGGGGADIGPLKSQGTTLIGLLPDSQRYFDYHHTSIDTFEQVNKRELELGGAAMTALAILISEKGL